MRVSRDYGAYRNLLGLRGVRVCRALGFIGFLKHIELIYSL